MPTYAWYQWMAFFYFYCFFGWVFESTYVSIKTKHLVNRGFLRLPLLPLYGSGAVMMLWVSLPFRDSLVLTYLSGVAGATVLEYVTGYVMELLFKVRYWDYSSQKWNLNGYICLSSSIAWGFLTILMTEVVHRPVADFITAWPPMLTIVLVFAVTVVFLYDLNYSARRAFALGKSLEALTKLRGELKDILTNPVYCTADREGYEYFFNLGCQVCMEEEEADGKYGLISYGKTSSSQYKSKDNEPEKWIIAKGKHKGIISGKDFSKIQRLLARNSSRGDTWRKPQNPVALLSGLLYCSCGHLMRPKNYSSKQVTEKGERKFSYLCPYKDLTHGEKCSVSNVQGNTLDELVCKEVLRYTEENSNIHKMLEKAVERMEGTKQEKVSSVDMIEQEIQKRKKEVQNLISVLAKSGGDDEFIAQIEQKVIRLNRECAALEKEKSEIDEEGLSITGDKQQIEILMEQLSSFKKMFDTLSVLEKREYLQLILDKVVWDGEQAHIFIYGSH